MEYGLSLGSNLGDRLGHLRQARAAVAALPGVELSACSPVYETEPVDVRPEFRDRTFLNTVVLALFSGAPAAFARELQRIETALGRVRTDDRNAPRPIDLDIVFAGSLAIDEPGLRVPHPRWQERRFVAQPLADVRPDLVLPGSNRSVREVLLTLPAAPNVFLFARDW